MDKKKTIVEDIDRGLYDIKNKDQYRYKVVERADA
jgi:Fe-S cluster assembly protein SufB